MSWLPETRGQGRSRWSPSSCTSSRRTERYRVIFMERDLDEMLLSQEKMLARLGKPAAPRDEIKQAFIRHLERLREWLAEQPHIDVLYVRYNDLVERPEEQAARVKRFLGGRADVRAHGRAVDPALYRNRKTSEPHS